MLALQSVHTPWVLTDFTTDRMWTLCRLTIIISSKVRDRICTRYLFKNLWITNHASQISWEKYITCLLKSMELKCILIDFWRYQVLTILLSHGFLEIFENYMSPKIRENIFQSHGFHGFHEFLEIYPILGIKNVLFNLINYLIQRLTGWLVNWVKITTKSFLHSEIHY